MNFEDTENLIQFSELELFFLIIAKIIQTMQTVPEATDSYEAHKPKQWENLKMIRICFIHGKWGITQLILITHLFMSILLPI